MWWWWWKREGLWSTLLVGMEVCRCDEREALLAAAQLISRMILWRHWSRPCMAASCWCLLFIEEQGHAHTTAPWFVWSVSANISSIIFEGVHVCPVWGGEWWSYGRKAWCGVVLCGGCYGVCCSEMWFALLNVMLLHWVHSVEHCCAWGSIELFTRNDIYVGGHVEARAK